MLAWPALLNRYPILFSDTGGLLLMGLRPDMGWDKPFVYGPVLAALDLRQTLWLPVTAQALIVSYMLWQVLDHFPPVRWGRHFSLCLFLAALTTAPWVTSTLMPDVFTPLTILGIFALADPTRRHAGHLAAMVVITAIAIAAHLSNLVVSAACIASIAMLFRTVPWRPMLSLAAAIAFLLGSNWIGHGRLGISPYGSIFALARLVADGPARDYLDRVCPTAGYGLCASLDRLTTDSDQFLWDPDGPLWTDKRPVGEFAAEASQIVTSTLRNDPLHVLIGAARNTARELVSVRLGDTLAPSYLDAAVQPVIASWFPAAELRRYQQSSQVRGTLLSTAAPFILITLVAAALALIADGLILLRALRSPSKLGDLTAFIMIALLANAFATGALSAVHDRYQSRAVWLLAIPPFLAVTTPRGRSVARNTSGSHPPQPA